MTKVPTEFRHRIATLLQDFGAIRLSAMIDQSINREIHLNDRTLGGGVFN